MQKKFLLDPAPKKAAVASRRSGKTTAVGIDLVKTALDNPGCTCICICLTRDQAKKIYFKNIIKKLDKKYDLKLNYNETNLSCKFPNGSEIFFYGINTGDLAQVIYGMKIKKAVIDEAAFYRTDLKELIELVVEPCLYDEDGTLLVISTTSSKKKGYFYDITKGLVPEFSVHKWSYKDNPFMAEKMEKRLQQKLAADPQYKTTPEYYQTYSEGEWLEDDSRLVYGRFDYDLNTYTGLLPEGKYTFLMSVDIGWNDNTAISIGTYSEFDPTLYVVEVFRQPKLIISQIAAKIKEFQAKYNVIRIIADSGGQSKTAVEEIKARYGIPIEPAQKMGKIEFIELLNSDLATGKIKIHEKDASALIEEYENLVWDEASLNKGEKKERQNQTNDASDSTLYLFRYAMNYRYMLKPTVLTINDPEYWEQFWQRESDQMQKAMQDPFWVRDWEEN